MPMNGLGLWEGGIWRKVAVLVGSATAAVAVLVLVERYLRKRRGFTDLQDEGIEMDMVDEPEAEDPDNTVKRVVVLGLDGVGKSSFLSCIANQDCRQTMKPTEGFNVMCIQTRQSTLNIWEIGGTEKVRSYWSNFLPDTHVLVFVVDSTDVTRLPKVKEELQKVLAHPALKAVPLLVLANKQDADEAMSVDQVSTALNLDSHCADRPVHILPTEVPPGLPTKTDSTKRAEEMLTTLCRS